MAQPATPRSDDRSNGSTRFAPHGLATVGGGAIGFDDPMARVLGLDASSWGQSRWLGYTLAAIALMLGLAVGVRGVGVLLAMTDVPPPPPQEAQEVDIVRDEPPPPPPEPKEEPKPEPVMAPPPRAVHEAPPPPPAPAQAGKVLTAAPDPNEPVDLTGNTIISGNADSYAGGVTAANGTSPTAVRSLAASPKGVPGGTGTPTAAPVAAGPDRSRPPGLVGGDEWNCGFPPEADTAQMDEAYVTVQVDVRPDGTASNARALNDPGFGFARLAKSCAIAKHFTSALDHDGNPIAGTKAFRVHFSR